MGNNPFGMAYKFVRKKLKCLNAATLNDSIVLDKIVKNLFPQEDITTWENNTPGEEYCKTIHTSTCQRDTTVSIFQNRKDPILF